MRAAGIYATDAGFEASRLAEELDYLAFLGRSGPTTPLDACESASQQTPLSVLLMHPVQNEHGRTPAISASCGRFGVSVRRIAGVACTVGLCAIASAGMACGGREAGSASQSASARGGESSATPASGTPVPGPGSPRRCVAESVGTTGADSVGAGGAADDSRARWVQAHMRPVGSPRADGFDDLRVLGPFVSGRRIVQLGESTHQAGELDALKVRVIKYLHERQGYDLIALESPLFECSAPAILGETRSAHDLLNRCVWGVWRVEEMLPLFEYVRQTQRTAHPLVLAGFDVQLSASPGAVDRPAFLAAVVGQRDTTYARRVFSLDSSVVAQVQSTPELRLDPGTAARFQAGYDTLLRFLASPPASEPTASRALLARAIARSMPPFLAQLTTVQLNGTGRDQAMAETVRFLVDSLYPGRRAVVWAHNAHVRYGSGMFQSSASSMGYWLRSFYGDAVYTLGLYAIRGRELSPAGSRVELSPPRPNSLEAVLSLAKREQEFLDLSCAARTAGSEWIDHALAGGVTVQSRNETVTPGRDYDALLFVERVNPPVHLPPPVTRPCCPGSPTRARR